MKDVDKRVTNRENKETEEMKEEIKAQMTIVKATADRAVQMKKIHDAQWIQDMKEAHKHTSRVDSVIPIVIKTLTDAEKADLKEAMVAFEVQKTFLAKQKLAVEEQKREESIKHDGSLSDLFSPTKGTAKLPIKAGTAKDAENAEMQKMVRMQGLMLEQQRKAHELVNHAGEIGSVNKIFNGETAAPPPPLQPSPQKPVEDEETKKAMDLQMELLREQKDTRHQLVNKVLDKHDADDLFGSRVEKPAMIKTPHTKTADEKAADDAVMMQRQLMEQQLKVRQLKKKTEALSDRSTVADLFSPKPKHGVKVMKLKKSANDEESERLVEMQKTMLEQQKEERRKKKEMKKQTEASASETVADLFGPKPKHVVKVIHVKKSANDEESEALVEMQKKMLEQQKEDKKKQQMLQKYQGGDIHNLFAPAPKENATMTVKQKTPTVTDFETLKAYQIQKQLLSEQREAFERSKRSAELPGNSSTAESLFQHNPYKSATTVVISEDEKATLQLVKMQKKMMEQQIEINKQRLQKTKHDNHITYDLFVHRPKSHVLSGSEEDELEEYQRGSHTTAAISSFTSPNTNPTSDKMELDSLEKKVHDMENNMVHPSETHDMPRTSDNSNIPIDAMLAPARDILPEFGIIVTKPETSDVDPGHTSRKMPQVSIDFGIDDF